jgi:hypothetical protein
LIKEHWAYTACVFLGIYPHLAFQISFINKSEKYVVRTLEIAQNLNAVYTANIF